MITPQPRGRADPSGGTPKVLTILNLAAVTGFMVYMFLV